MPRDAAIAHANPPLPFTKDAIVNQLRHQATNGPAYVQHSATKALAHLKGLYAEARYEARLAYETARQAVKDAAQQVKEQVDDAGKTLGEKLEDIRTGRTIVTAEMLGRYAIPVGDGTEEAATDEEEDGSNHAEDEPP